MPWCRTRAGRPPTRRDQPIRRGGDCVPTSPWRRRRVTDSPRPGGRRISRGLRRGGSLARRVLVGQRSYDPTATIRRPDDAPRDGQHRTIGTIVPMVRCCPSRGASSGRRMVAVGSYERCPTSTRRASDPPRRRPRLIRRPPGRGLSVTRRRRQGLVGTQSPPRRIGWSRLVGGRPARVLHHGI